MTTKIVIELEIEGKPEDAFHVVDTMLDNGCPQDNINEHENEDAGPLHVISATCSRIVMGDLADGTHEFEDVRRADGPIALTALAALEAVGDACRVTIEGGKVTSLGGPNGATLEMPHRQDGDCVAAGTVDPEGHCTDPNCGVSGGVICHECGGERFHRPTCSEYSKC